MYFEDSAKCLKDNFLMVFVGLGLVYITFKVLKYTKKRVGLHRHYRFTGFKLLKS